MLRPSTRVSRAVLAAALGGALVSPALAALPAAAATSVKAQHKSNDSAPSDNQIKPGLQLVNSGTASLDLSTVKVRYYFTKDGSESLTYACDWAQMGCGNVRASFQAVSPATATADTYLELSLTGSLAPGASTGEIQSRIHKTNWGAFNETNDYSHGTGTAFADAPKVTVHVGGTLAWGTPPGSSGSEPTATPTPTADPNDTTPPSTPAGLQVTGTTSNSVSLSWSASTDNVGVVAYDVFRGATKVGSPTGTSFTDTGLSAATSYTYTVKARDGAGNSSAASASVAAATKDAPVLGTYGKRFLELYDEIHDPANGYFSPQGIPYHSIETLIVEAPDHGHETTSEAYSFWMWLEATYGRVTGDWAPFNHAWAITEKYMIPQQPDQPTNSFYSASKPASYAPENAHPSLYPSMLNTSVPVGVDPIGNELKTTYGTSDIYGMHWIADVDNVYGFGNTPGGGCELGPTAKGTSYINTFQRGPQESVFETIPQPTCDKFAYGGPNGYLDLFIKDSSYAKQWKFTNAPDADARAVQAAYWAHQWATEQGKAAEVAQSIAKAAKMGDYLRYSLFDKYFKRIGNCTSATTCPAGTGRDSQHGLLSWYYAWGGALDTSAGWAWRIGSSHSHFGYQNPFAAWALASVPALKPKSPTATSDWEKSLTRQLELYRWLQSAEGGIAGGVTNSWGGQYGTPPAGTPTFYGMFYEEAPVYNDPPSNQWFGMQAWSMERVAELYYTTGDKNAEAVLKKWVPWVMEHTTVNADGTWAIPATLKWTGAPDNWNPTTPGANANLHVTVTATGQDIGIAGALIRTLIHYAAKSGDTAARDLSKKLLDAIWTTNRDDKGLSSPETRGDYALFDDVLTSTTGDGVFVPSGWTGKMPNGDVIKPGVTALDIRSFYKNDPDWPKVQAYLDGGPAPVFRYHRFWAQADIAMAMADYDRLFPSSTTPTDPPADTTAPTAPTGLTATEKTTTSVSLTWTASTDNVGVTGYDVYRGSTKVGSPSTTSFTDTGLTPSTAYTYTVRARDAAGNTSTASAPLSVTTSADTTSSSPTPTTTT